jgi:quercetin dioxygenase-like cupin family protein
MKKKIWLAALIAAIPFAVSAQDASKVDAGHYKVLVDNASVRVLQVNVGVGEKSPMHAHPDAILVPLVSAKARFTLPDGKTEDRDLAADMPSYTPATTPAPANVGTTRVEAILVELKSKTAAVATLPTGRAGMDQKVLAEGPLGVAYKSTAAATFHEPAGSTHDFDQVVITLGPADMALSIDGKPTKSKWQRGDVEFVGRGVKHEAKNTGGKPVDFIIVNIK